jgi:hypothetical protein
VISASIRPPNAITDFLYRALAGGALGVEELEIKARATGLLGERQQIQHAKAFKKAKKALGIRSIRAGFGSSGKWAWLMPPQTATEIDRVANAHLDTNEQTSLSDAELSGQQVVASESRSIVHEWIEGVQRLDYVRSPTAIPLIRWHLFLGDCHSFLSSPENWAERAAALGWNALALFGCYRTRPLEHLGSAGLLPKLEKPMRKFHKRPSSPLDRLDDNAKLGAIEQAIEEAARMGLIVDSGERRWSERTGRYEIVWKSKVYERPN